jgi:hypothetical protein
LKYGFAIGIADKFAFVIEQLQCIPLPRVVACREDDATGRFSTVGVVDSSKSITSKPQPISVLLTNPDNIGPEIRASRPITIRRMSDWPAMNAA